MHYLVSFVLGFALSGAVWLASGWQSATVPAFADAHAVERWMAHYYRRPDPLRLRPALDVLDANGALAGEHRWKPVAAFVAALVAGDNGLVEPLTDRIAEASPAQQRVVAHAIALSGLPEWRRLLTVLKRVVPARALEIETLLAEPETRSTLALGLDEDGVVLDMLWAHYAATGSEDAALRIVAALGGAPPNARKARELLAIHAAADERLLQLCRREAALGPQPLAEMLRDIVAAAEGASASRTPQG